MKVALTELHTFNASIERVFDFTNDAANFVTFAGFGPVPGIRSAVYETPGEPRLGSRRRVMKTDGTEHIEEIVAFERPSLHVSRITNLTPPFSWLVRFGEDTFRFREANGKTVLERTFSFALTTPVALVIADPLLHLFFRGAIRRDLRNIDDALHKY